MAVITLKDKSAIALATVCLCVDIGNVSMLIQSSIWEEQLLPILYPVARKAA